MDKKILKRIYRLLGLDGRSSVGKQFKWHFIRLATGLEDEHGKLLLVAQAIKFQLENKERGLTGNELVVLMSYYRGLGLIDQEKIKPASTIEEVLRHAHED